MGEGLGIDLKRPVPSSAQSSHAESLYMWGLDTAVSSPVSQRVGIVPSWTLCTDSLLTQREMQHTQEVHST